jgi:predicted Holliday junction resolvase-like endonuclease
MMDFSILLTAGLATVAVAILGWLFLKEKEARSRVLFRLGQLEEQHSNLIAEFKLVSAERNAAVEEASHIDSEYKKLLNQKKSSEVRVGKIGENMAPFLEGWPYDPNSFRFLGNPIDGIQFADDKIRFIEIKTGGARLSQGQKKVRELILSGKVSFVSFRIGTDGCSLVEEDLEI